MIHKKDKDPQTNGAFRQTFQESLGVTKDTDKYQFAAEPGGIAAPALGFEDFAEPNREESTLKLAQDLYVRASILARTATSNIKKMDEAARQADPAFGIALSQMIEKINQQDLTGPIKACFERLHDEGLDRFSSLTRASASTLGELGNSNRIFLDLIKPGELRKVFVLTEEVRASVLRGANAVAQALISSEHFKSDIASLESTPAPKVAGFPPDEPAIAATAKIMAATYAAISVLIENPVSQSDDAGDPGAYRNIIGLSAMVMRNLNYQLAFCVAAELTNETSVKPHLPRILQVIKSLKFSSRPERHSAIMKASPKGEIFFSLLTSFKVKNPLESSISLLINTNELSEISNSIRDIPEDKLLDLSNEGENPRNYSGRMRLMWRSSSASKRVITVNMPSKDRDTAVAYSGERKEDYIFFISEQGELNYGSLSSLGSLTNLSQVELQLLSHDHPDLIRLADTMTRAVRHGRYILKQAEDLCPEIMCRVVELPKKLALVGEDDAILFLVESEELGVFLDLFKHKEDLYASMAKACSYDPKAGIYADRAEVYTFRVPLRMQEEEGDDEATQKPTVTLVTDEQEQLRREVKNLLHNRVKNFAQLFDILKARFDVTLDKTQGKGGHKMLCRFGHRFTLATDFRNPSAPLMVDISMNLIESLDISLENMKKVLESVKR